jgi:hypothetical protein
MGRVDVEKNNVDDVWETIKRQVNDLNYGTVTITIHDGKITQVETSSKVRF